MEESEEELPERCLVSFYLPLKRPMAIPVGRPFIGLREEPVEWLSEVSWPERFLNGADQFFGRKKNFVAFRFGHVLGEPTYEITAYHHAFQVASADLKRPTPTPEETSQRFLTAQGEEPQLRNTVLIMTTVVLHEIENPDFDPISHAFDICMEELALLELGYVLVTQDLAYRFTNLHSSFSMCLFFVFDASSFEWSGPRALQINIAAGFEITIPEFLSAQRIDTIDFYRAEAKRGLPVLTSARWIYLARQSLEIDGDYPSTVIQAYTASEVLLDYLLMAMAWEEIEHLGKKDLTVEIVAGWFSGQSRLSNRVRNYIVNRIKGMTTENADSPLNTLLGPVSLLRNKVVHAGYIPTVAEAREALNVSASLLTYISDCLVDDRNRNRYPRTIFIVVGDQGVMFRNKYKGKFRKLVEDSRHLDWGGEFLQFREHVLDAMSAGNISTPNSQLRASFWKRCRSFFGNRTSR